jgi:hypothetical protein
MMSRMLDDPDSLAALGGPESCLAAENLALGDFRPGSVTNTPGRCGNPHCHCHRPQDPGHGPNFRLTYKEKGETVTESFSRGTPQNRARDPGISPMAAVEPGIFGGECQPVLPAGDRRPRADASRKTAEIIWQEIIQQEISREVEHLPRPLFSKRRKSGDLDLEAVEMAICSAMHRAGALRHLLQFDAPVPEQRQLPCACGHTARYVELRSKPIVTAVGECFVPATFLPVRAFPSRSVSDGC